MMFELSRLLLVLVLLEFSFCAVVLTLLFWPWPLLIAAVLFGFQMMNKGKPLWAYGTAKWASADELRSNGMICGNKGLSIGRLENTAPSPLLPSLLSVIDSRVSAKEACERSILGSLQLVFRKKRGETVRLIKTPHTAVFSPTGGGKGTSFIVPWLLEMDESAVVLDFKGENAAISARHRERLFGHRTVLLDPFHVVTRSPDCLNPIDFLEKDCPHAIDECRDLAEQLVVRTGEERETHWNDSAEMWIAGTSISVVQSAQYDNRSLQTVRDVLSNPDKIPQLLELLCRSEGLVSRLGGQLAHFREKELSSVLTTTNRHLRFLDTPAVAENTRTSSFDPADLRHGKMTVYCILPPEHMRAQSALIRMWIGTLLRAVVKGGLQHG